jgi:YbbR domain-containing protein
VNILRGLLLDNLGIKLVALLLAVLVYLNVYTDRPATGVVTFRMQITDLGDSLSLSGAVPSTVQAELRGTGKQIIFMRLAEPAVKISLADVRAGRFTRALTAADLALPSGLELVSENSLSPSQVELTVDHRVTRTLPVTARLDGQPPAGIVWNGSWRATPAQVAVTGPAQVIAAMDSVPLVSTSLAGHHDALKLRLAPLLPDWCVADPPLVELTVPLTTATPR